MKETIEKTYRCLSCGGDGKETCNNPDHGLLSMMNGAGALNANESACPCCGHSDDHKIRKWDQQTGKYFNPPCWECSGTGVMTERQANEYADEYGIEEDIEDFAIPQISIESSPNL